MFYVENCIIVPITDKIFLVTGSLRKPLVPYKVEVFLLMEATATKSLQLVAPGILRWSPILVLAGPDVA